MRDRSTGNGRTIAAAADYTCRVPIYEYRCDGCTEQFEELLRTVDAQVSCPSCGSAAVTRLLSSFATEWKPSNVDWHRVPGNTAHD
jgi:putative FmdB family regulatory protein